MNEKLEQTRKEARKYMTKISVAVANAWIRTVIDIKRYPRLHTLIATAIPPYISWICEDVKEVCDIHLYNVLEELEYMGLMGIAHTEGNRYIVDVYEKLTL